MKIGKISKNYTNLHTVCMKSNLKGGYAHSNMHIFHFELIDLDL